ncbi:MAG: serine/threonine protein kinase [Candelina mexicana]|nr:MAG: serine/threonine protein kinase [Candelina mexicana]
MASEMQSEGTSPNETLRPPAGIPFHPKPEVVKQTEVERAAAGTSTAEPLQQAVRFASTDQEIEPAASLQSVETPLLEGRESPEEFTPEAQAEFRTISQSIRESRLHQGRMSNFVFEPISLPPSRAPSPDTQRPPSRDALRYTGSSPDASPSTSRIHSPPLTPAATHSLDSQSRAIGEPGEGVIKVQRDPVLITPQISPPRGTPPPIALGKAFESDNPPSTTTSRPSSSSEMLSSQPTSLSSGSAAVAPHPKHIPNFTIGASGDSGVPSRASSPTSRPSSTVGTTTPPQSRPFTPVGDKDDPYARSKRAPQSQNLSGIENRFMFNDTRRRSGQSSTAMSSTQVPRSNSRLELKDQHKHHSHLFGGRHQHDDGAKHQGSMSDLKRFFRLGHKKRGSSPAGNKSGTRTPPHQLSQPSVPFGEDELHSKYGRLGKVLGSGAGGSVRLIKRTGDGTTFAVKQFRARHAYETEKDYSKKVTAEFCVGSTLHHGNIIETLDIIHENGNWYEVMEYAPYDLFAIVMTGKMSREEIACSFLQIVSGVTYLHGMGLAHRDLKLDNVVVNDKGIMKLIDFGSATVFQYPFENSTVLATGIVGSDPYLAPEVYDSPKYDPEATDIWSLAIIFCCMSLRRFPWKAPKATDNSFKLFASAPTQGQPSGERRISERPKSTADLVTAQEDRRRSAPNQENASRQGSNESAPPHKHRHHHHHHGTDEGQPEAAAKSNENLAVPQAGAAQTPQQQPILKGPWRLLRLLPRESRNVIGIMLEIDPKRRAKLDEVLEDPWVANTPICSQEVGGKVYKAPNHEHTLEPGTAVTSVPSKGKGP